MNSPKSVFVAGTCISGLSVVKAMWDANLASDICFMADYEVNPLGVKNKSAIADTVSKWFCAAREKSGTLIIACNTPNNPDRE